MQQFNLVDSCLYYLNSSRYQNSLVSDRFPQHFEWVSGDYDLPTFYTHSELENFDGRAKENNIILLESTAIIPQYAKWVWSNHKNFHRIYTHNSDLLGLCPNARWIPGGGVWIGTEWGGGEIAIKPKNKLCSFVSSAKSMCSLHRTRLSAFEFIRSKQAGNIKDNNIVLFGPSVGSPFVKAADYLQDYMFSIIFENYVDDLYFTEKILNCFATGTVPIYIGARKIDSLFNADGIMKFDNVAGLMNIIRTLSVELYESKRSAIQSNFDKCKKYICIEDYMWSNYMKDEYERRNPTE